MNRLREVPAEGWWLLALCVVIAAACGWPIPDLLS